MGRGSSVHRKKVDLGPGVLQDDFVMSFDQLRQLDGYWLFMMLSKDLQGKKDGSTSLTSSGLSKLP